MGFINQEWFDRPSSIARARGDIDAEQRRRELPVTLANGAAFTPIASGGMIAPREHVIAIGTRLVRFGKGPLTPDAAGGDWWLEFAEYRKIERYADAHGISVPFAVRKFCCVMPEWNDMTMVLQARGMQPLIGYRGLGAPVTAKGQVVFDAKVGEELGVMQLFIPGLSVGDVRRETVFITGYGFLPNEASTLGYVPKNA